MPILTEAANKMRNEHNEYVVKSDSKREIPSSPAIYFIPNLTTSPTPTVARQEDAIRCASGGCPGYFPVVALSKLMELWTLPNGGCRVCDNSRVTVTLLGCCHGGACRGNQELGQ